MHTQTNNDQKERIAETENNEEDTELNERQSEIMKNRQKFYNKVNKPKKR